MGGLQERQQRRVVTQVRDPWRKCMAKWRQASPRCALAEERYGRRALGGFGADDLCPYSEIVARLLLIAVSCPFCFRFLSLFYSST